MATRAKAAAGSDTSNTEAGGDRKNLLGDALRRRIIGMEMPPGATVDEVALSEEFGLSRPPVRELMRQMAAEGYLELEPNRPARVSAMSYQSLRSFFQAAPLLYIATAQLAAHNALPFEIDELKAIQARFRAALAAGDIDGRVLHNDAFHQQIGLMAHNDYLLPSLRRLLIDHARLAKIFYRQPSSNDMQADLDAAVRQHDDIIAAIEGRDAARAGELVREHMELSRRRMTEFVVPPGVEVPLMP